MKKTLWKRGRSIRPAGRRWMDRCNLRWSVHTTYLPAAQACTSRPALSFPVSDACCAMAAYNSVVAMPLPIVLRHVYGIVLMYMDAATNWRESEKHSTQLRSTSLGQVLKFLSDVTRRRTHVTASECTWYDASNVTTVDMHVDELKRSGTRTSIDVMTVIDESLRSIDAHARIASACVWGSKRVDRIGSEIARQWKRPVGGATAGGVNVWSCMDADKGATVLDVTVSL
jgi:hypothetical protein